MEELLRSFSLGIEGPILGFVTIPIYRGGHTYSGHTYRRAGLIDAIPVMHARSGSEALRLYRTSHSVCGVLVSSNEPRSLVRDRLDRGRTPTCQL